MKRTSTLLCLLACGVMANGCARAIVTTKVKSDGSYTRSLRLRAPKPNDMGFSAGPKLEDAFVLPSGLGWKAARTTEKDEIVFSAERAFGKGEAAQRDVVIKGKKAPMGWQLVNTATVREVAPGRWEYQEVLHWQGERPKELVNAEPEVMKKVKEVLPPLLATDANARDVTVLFQRHFWRVLFGPSDPLLSQILMHPDLAERRVKQRVSATLDRAIQEKFGNRISSTERLAMTRKLIAAMDPVFDVRSDAKAKAEAGPPGQGDNDGAFVALTFVVKLPGKVVATNGELDEVNGEVFWALYDMAAAMEDVVLTATYEVGK